MFDLQRESLCLDGHRAEIHRVDRVDLDVDATETRSLRHQQEREAL
jgi:hypothetical protein